MQRESTVPIAVWLPALAAILLLAWSWHHLDVRRRGSFDHSNPPPRESLDLALIPTESSAAAPPAAAALARDAPGESTAEEEAAPADRPRQEAAAPAVGEPTPAAPSRPVVEPSSAEAEEIAGDSRELEKLPPGWELLVDRAAAEPGPSTFARAAATFFASTSARLGPAAARHAASGDTLAPFVVVAPLDDENAIAAAAALTTFRERLLDRVLRPARLEIDWSDHRPIELDWTSPPGDASGPDRARAWGDAWLAGLFEVLGLNGPLGLPPRWWCDGAVEVARHATLQAALLAAPADASLATLLADRAEPDRAEPDRAEPDRAVAGSFAAFCLGAAGRDEHRRATWLELARAPPAAGDSASADLAARFGCTRLEELAALWDAARRP